jgi:AraC family transcriptional regulator, regulatory protein of adaptative response / methylated-DNA-[protein]-cysteine methyltransferase
MSDQSPAYHFSVIGRALAIIDEAPPNLTLEDLAARPMTEK